MLRFSKGYRYGYQAQEKGNEIYGRGASYYYRYRQQDARLGRFWSVDPLVRKYPWNSLYAFAENRLVDGVEWEGLEWQAVRDASGSVTGFRWVGSLEGLDENGNLREDHYWTIILVRDYGRNDLLSWPTREFNASFYVGDAYGNIHVFRGSTLPGDGSPALAGGFYIGYLGRHRMSDSRGYPAVDIYGEDGRRTGLPAITIRGEAASQRGINIHRPGRNNKLISTPQAPISKGCFTVDRRYFDSDFIPALLPPGQGEAELRAYVRNPFQTDRQRAIGILVLRHFDALWGWEIEGVVFNQLRGSGNEIRIRHSDPYRTAARLKYYE